MSIKSYSHQQLCLRLLGAIALAALFATPAAAQVTSYTIANVGGETRLVRVNVNGTTYSVNDLVPIDITHFQAGGSSVNIAAPVGATPASGTRAALLDQDVALNTGTINPGGSGTPPTSDPTTSTPGITFDFAQPVVNQAGSDVVFFEIQTTGNPAAGDAINVTPLSGVGSGLNSAAVASYDIQFNDANAFTVADFDLSSYDAGAPQSLNELENNAISNLSGNPRSGFQALAVGIDLGSLGYAAGATASGLHIQDNDGSGSVVDPVFIAGVPDALPDQVVSYAATTNSDGDAEQLTSVTVQRGGIEQTIDAGELILGQLTHFKGGSNAANIAVDENAGDPGVGNRSSLLRDLQLNSGVINPGFSSGLTSDPVIDNANPANSTVGMAIAFDQPVTNGPGPDVLFFEVQADSNEPTGDIFHVGPLSGIGSGLNSITVGAYDIDFDDLEALTVGDFDLFEFGGGSPQSLSELENNAISELGGNPRTGFKALVAAIDLTDLGYMEGDLVDGLFFQANSDDRIDPVLIAGLPAVQIPEPTSVAIWVLVGIVTGGIAWSKSRRRTLA